MACPPQLAPPYCSVRYFSYAANLPSKTDAMLHRFSAPSSALLGVAAPNSPLHPASLSSPPRPARSESCLPKNLQLAGHMTAITNNAIIPQVCQACLQHDLEGKATTETYMNLEKATDFSLRMTIHAAQDTGRIMGLSG